MHELSLCLSLVDEVQEIMQQNKCSKVHHIELSIGSLSGVDPHALEFAFPEATRGTPMQGCTLKFSLAPVIINCKNCQKRSTLNTPVLICSHCGAADVQMISGREFKITKMEIE